METKTLVATLTPAVVKVIEAQADRLEQAKGLLASIRGCEKGMFDMRDKLLCASWYLGEILVDMKDDVGHGRWLPYLAGHWPDLDERDARRYMAFYRENAEQPENRRNSGDLVFSQESVRKFMWGYIPVKERPELEGDERTTPAAHHLTVINHFFKWERQLSQGHAGPRPPVEQMRRDFEPVILRQVELLGRDWLLQLIEHADAAAAAANG